MHNQSPRLNAVRGISQIFPPGMNDLKHYYDPAYNEIVMVQSSIGIWPSRPTCGTVSDCFFMQRPFEFRRPSLGRRTGGSSFRTGYRTGSFRTSICFAETSPRCICASANIPTSLTLPPFGLRLQSVQSYSKCVYRLLIHRAHARAPRKNLISLKFTGHS